MLFEHEAPLLDSGEQGLFERSSIDKEPRVNHLSTLYNKMEAYENIAIY